jgi:hypothetical protein
MAIRKRYIGRIRLVDTPREVFVESVALSKFERKQGKSILDDLHELIFSSLQGLKLSIDDIDAFVVANSMGGLFGIPEFMRYVVPSVVGNHRAFFEVNCEEAGGLCAVVKAYDLIKSGLANRVCILSANKMNLEDIDEIANIVFMDVLQPLQEFIERHIQEGRLKQKDLQQIFSIAYEKAKKNPFVKAELPKKIDYLGFVPRFNDGAGVVIISSGDVAKSKLIKIALAEERTELLETGSNADEIKVISSLARSVCEKLKISSLEEYISIFEVYDFNPLIGEVVAESLGLSGGYLIDGKSKNKIDFNPSGGVFFENSPPVSSLSRFAHSFFSLKDRKDAKRALSLALSLRTLSHASLVILEKLK